LFAASAGASKAKKPNKNLDPAFAAQQVIVVAAADMPWPRFPCTLETLACFYYMSQSLSSFIS